MSEFQFEERVLRGDAIDVYHTADGSEMRRDFTYVDDIVDGIIRCLEFAADYEVFNLGRGEPSMLSIFTARVSHFTLHIAYLSSPFIPNFC